MEHNPLPCKPINHDVVTWVINFVSTTNNCLYFLIDRLDSSNTPPIWLQKLKAFHKETHALFNASRHLMYDQTLEPRSFVCVEVVTKWYQLYNPILTHFEALLQVDTLSDEIRTEITLTWNAIKWATESPHWFNHYMPDYGLAFVPRDINFQPEFESVQRAEKVLKDILPIADSVTHEYLSDITFFNTESKWSPTFCKDCGDSLTDWWFPTVKKAHQETGFADLKVTPPCCGKTTSLNDINSWWPTAFGRFALYVYNPKQSWVPSPQLARISQTLGCTMKQICFRHTARSNWLNEPKYC